MSINSDPASLPSVPDSAVPYLTLYMAVKGGSGKKGSRERPAAVGDGVDE